MKQQVAPQQAKEKIPREEWMNWDWEEISESQFNKIAPPDAMYDPANDPNLYSRG
jgi:hypothetical protein